MHKAGLVDVLVDEVVNTVARSGGGGGIGTGGVRIHAQRGPGIVEALGFGHVVLGAVNEELGGIAAGVGRLGVKDGEHVLLVDGASAGEGSEPQKGKLGKGEKHLRNTHKWPRRVCRNSHEVLERQIQGNK